MDILHIRPAISSDFTALEDIFSQCEKNVSILPVPANAEEIKAFIGDYSPEYPVFVAQKGQVIGIGCLLPFTNFSALRKTCCIGIFVREDKRGQGVGRAMLDYALSECTRLGYHVALSPVHADNHRALELFSRSGFSHDAYLPQAIALEDGYSSLLLLWKTVE